MGLNFISTKKTSNDYEEKKVSKYDPKPNHFEIKNVYESNGHCIIYINYPNCINYEGNKVLVFKDTKKEEIEKLNEIDPHFTDSENIIKPIARFELTYEGWNLAIKFIENILI